ncbi:iron-containing redox enzyme family protein [Cryobacterium fucosi]|uniref:Iron-containing redox enzyme family protein n=1 Tax=Cryobacterium fucosi TaxID=1259157 RepID=A0A4V3IUD0_9MICO|nr:iron-containing redox enzyme family protein [Cryobacterium fucosi]TFD72037.1 iron-containing redox enzyme family protein [Cryobacterium fucosi]
MQLSFPIAPFQARGPLSSQLLTALSLPANDSGSSLGGFIVATAEALARCTDIVNDDDLQLTLFLLYGLHYGGAVESDAAWEWHPTTIVARVAIEQALETSLRASVSQPPVPAPTQDAVARALFTLTIDDQGPSLSRYLARKATEEQVVEFIVHRSIYTLKEADPHSWAIPRLAGRAKAALIEIQADEYGGGRPDRMHSRLFADTMRGLGLDTRYAGYVDQVPALVLCSFNMMSLFGLNRRLRGAIVGHLAAFEMTSAIPSRLYGDGFRRLGFSETITRYFDEHIEADAVHEQIAGRDLAGALAEDDPLTLPDIMFGAAACLAMDGWVADHLLASWQAGRSSLRSPLPEPAGRSLAGSAMAS